MRLPRSHEGTLAVSLAPRFERFVLAVLAHLGCVVRASFGPLARVVARAAIEDRSDGGRPIGETLTALYVLPDPRLAT
jgi:hypothetical protein